MTIKLDIISDVACPWCYVGKAYLDRALQARPDHPFDIEWHPYQLNPDMPEGGMDRMAYMEAKFGSRENIVRVYEPLLAHAEKAGVTLDLPAIRRAPNTLDAHRLIHWAGLDGHQEPIVSALFRAYWQEGRDIGDRAILADVATDAGMDRAVVVRLLVSDADRDTISKRVHHSRQRGVGSVPTFILAGQHAIQGAQPTELWLNIMNDILDSEKENMS